MKHELQIKLRRVGKENNVVQPEYATEGSAGVDLYACLQSNVVIDPGETAKISTGWAIELPGPDIVALVCARSGLATKHGITLANGVGVIDSDYRGEVQVAVINLGREPFSIADGDRIAQMLFIPVYQAKFSVVEELSETNRGAGGFGSTGM